MQVNVMDVIVTHIYGVIGFDAKQAMQSRVGMCLQHPSRFLRHHDDWYSKFLRCDGQYQFICKFVGP